MLKASFRPAETLPWAHRTQNVVSKAAYRLAKGSRPFDQPAVFRDIWPTRISVGTRMRIPGGTEMRRLFRQLVYLLLCGQGARTRISVGTRMRIPGGTEMRSMCKCGVASRRRRPGHKERGIMVRNRALSTSDMPASAPRLSAEQLVVRNQARSPADVLASAPRVHTELAPMDTEPGTFPSRTARIPLPTIGCPVRASWSRRRRRWLQSRRAWKRS